MDVQKRGSNLLMSFREIENLMLLKEPAGRNKMFRTLLNGQASSYFDYHLRERLEAEDFGHSLIMKSKN
jgi:hypothetical protein